MISPTEKIVVDKSVGLCENFASFSFTALGRRGHRENNAGSFNRRRPLVEYLPGKPSDGGGFFILHRKAKASAQVRNGRAEQSYTNAQTTAGKPTKDYLGASGKRSGFGRLRKYKPPTSPHQVGNRAPWSLGDHPALHRGSEMSGHYWNLTIVHSPYIGILALCLGERQSREDRESGSQF